MGYTDLSCCLLFGAKAGVILVFLYIFYLLILLFPSVLLLFLFLFLLLLLFSYNLFIWSEREGITTGHGSTGPDRRLWGGLGQPLGRASEDWGYHLGLFPAACWF